MSLSEKTAQSWAANINKICNKNAIAAVAPEFSENAQERERDIAGEMEKYGGRRPPARAPWTIGCKAKAGRVSKDLCIVIEGVCPLNIEKEKLPNQPL